MPDMGDGAGDGSPSTEAAGGTSEPGFGEGVAGESLPDMRDELPTFEEDYGSEGGEAGSESGDMAENAGSGEGGSGSPGDGQEGSEVAGSPPGQGTPGGMGEPGQPGTRAEGGMEVIAGVDGPLTTAERVAILDRQLEQSTGDFDAIILEEQARQREMDRARSERSSQRETPEPAGPGTSGRSPYEETPGGGPSSQGGGMGGVGGSSAPGDVAIYKPPADIPEGNNDDVVARQLREAAMREPDPEVRERLWNEYRKYKGLEIPEE